MGRILDVFSIARGYEPTLLDLEKWLQLRVLARTDAYLPAIERKGKQKSDAPPEDKRSLPTGRPKKDTPGKQPEKKAPPSKEPEKKQKSKCQYCGDQHRIYSCEKYKAISPKERQEFVVKADLCYNCLGRDHAANKCPSKRTCIKDSCGQRHHTSLHDVYVKAPAPPSDDNNEKAEEDKTIGVMTTGVNQVFLQVLPIRVINSKGNSVTAFALLDQGSQCTLIREDLADAAEIQGISENVRIGTIQGPGEVQSVSSTSFTIGSLVNKNTTFQRRKRVHSQVFALQPSRTVIPPFRKRSSTSALERSRNKKCIF